VNEPKNFGMPGKKVAIIAPKSSGTIIIPPGTRSIARLIGSWAIIVSCMEMIEAIILK
jgi:virulence-associated protein VagC